MRFPWLTLQSYLSAVRSFGDMNILERRGTLLLAEKLEAFPIFRPNAADDMPLDRSSLVCIWVVVGMSLIMGRRVFAWNVLFYESILLCPLYSYHVAIHLRAPYCHLLSPSFPPIICSLDLSHRCCILMCLRMTRRFGRFSVLFSIYNPIHTFTSRPPFAPLHKFFNLRLCPT